ncbi:MAG: class II fructose-bisphosphate aldolase [Spirochaetia bacterium]|jgi:ketose-bisphosphate aldolase
MVTQKKKLDVGAILAAADAGGFAVPAFNYSDIWDFLAIVEAAEELDAPIFISSNQQVVTEIGIELTGAFGAAAIDKARIPLIHHLDHSNKVEICRAAVDNRYPSVMIDASARPLAENIAAVKQVVGYAHPHGVFVEGEVGRIQGMGVEGMYTGTDYLARVEDVEQLVAESGVDSLAAGIGTAHGFYKGKPEIHFDLLAKINAAVKVPLVLHGGTGIPEEDVRRAIRSGINKVNVGTIIHCTYMNALRAELNARGENPYTLDVMKQVRLLITNVVKQWIKVCMADGKAKGLR